MVDPFQDEGAPQRIQAKPINFRRAAPQRPAGTYGVQFNDQAIFRYRVPASAGGRQVIPAASQAKPNPAQKVHSGVVRASATQPARLPSSNAVKQLPASAQARWPGASERLDSNPVRSATQQSATDAYYNPLRQ
ncbi:MAG: hypothetical protein Aurels2KO_19870 [Aureliella sp.]